MASAFIDYYKLLGVDSDATPEQLRKAYRKESLKCHPDKNTDDKQAVERFYALKEAFDLLAAPDKRAAYDSKRESALKQEQRFASLNGKRQADLADLHAREEAFKRQKTAQRDERNELERIKEQNARLMKERLARPSPAPNMAAETPPASPGTRSAFNNNMLGEHDTKVSLKWPATVVAAALNNSASLEAELNKLCGDVLSCAVLPKRKAVVEFARLASAVKAVELSGKSGTVLEGVNVTWLMGEPKVVAAARQRGTVRPSSPAQNGHSAPTPPTTTTAVDEDAVLAKMREQRRRKAEERARMEAEILAQDAEEERLASAAT